MKKFRPRPVVASVAAAAILTLTLGGCMDKYTEPFKDAHRSGTNSGPAEVGTMPDGFSNWATKCDNGNRVYVLYHGDNKYGSVAVVPADPTCRQ